MAISEIPAQKTGLDKELKIGDDFSLPSYETWRKLAEESLKGGSFEKKLLTQTTEGIQLQPIYTSESLKDMELAQIPGSGNFIRGTESGGYVTHPWQVAQELMNVEVNEVGEMAKKAVERGQDALVFPLHLALRSASVEVSDVLDQAIWAHTLGDFTAMLGGLNLQKYPLHIDGGVNGLEVLAMLVARQREQKQPIEALRGSIVSDPLAILAQTGKLSADLPSILDKMAVAVNWADSCCRDLRTVGINGLLLRQAGADAVMELAGMLSMGTYYLDELVARELSVDSIARSMTFTSGIGPFFFMEIAKFRALRVLWAKVIDAYGGQGDARKVWVRAQTSVYDWTRYDRHVNMLRATTEAFSAVVGGVDALTVTPFNRPSGEEDDFARRVSRNLQIILRDESHLDRVIDPAGGSYYVEWLTQQLIDKAWALFVEIDEADGYLPELKSGGIQARINQSRQLRDKDVMKRKQILVGINAYANVNEALPATPRQDAAAQTARAQEAQKKIQFADERVTRIKHEALTAICEKSDDVVRLLAEGYLKGASLFNLQLGKDSDIALTVTPLTLTRLAEPFEILRDQVALRRPRVILLTMGALAEYKGRADFSKAFMDVAGFEVIYPEGLTSAAEAMAVVQKNQADIAVICSLDDKYPHWLPELVKPLKALHPTLQIVLAGYPKEQAEEYRLLGVDEFIFLGCDAHKILCDLFQKSEVKK